MRTWSNCGRRPTEGNAEMRPKDGAFENPKLNRDDKKHSSVNKTIQEK